MAGKELEGIRLVSSGVSVSSGDFMLYEYHYLARENYDDTSFRLIKEVDYQKNSDNKNKA